MATCYHCHRDDKEFWAPICHNCNMYTPFMTQLGIEFLMKIVAPIASLALFVAIVWGAYTWAISSEENYVAEQKANGTYVEPAPKPCGAMDSNPCNW